MNSPSVKILLVEDNPADIELTKEALKESKLTIDLTVVEDGAMALDYLSRKDKYSKSTRPDLVLLDLNLPKVDGREVLSWVKQDEDLKKIPVVILTTSEADKDILKTYKSYANCYIKKPVDFNEFIDVIRNIESFWFTIVKLPSGA